MVYTGIMVTKTTSVQDSLRWYRGANIPMRVIRNFARAVADRFQPGKIILFGSYAYGKPHDDSDVDILVVMPARNELDMAFKIHSTLLPCFPLDILVNRPDDLKARLEKGDSFLTEIVSKGKVLYEQSHARVGRESRRRLDRRPKARART